MRVSDCRISPSDPQGSSQLLLQCSCILLDASLFQYTTPWHFRVDSIGCMSMHEWISNKRNTRRGEHGRMNSHSKLIAVDTSRVVYASSPAQTRARRSCADSKIAHRGRPRMSHNGDRCPTLNSPSCHIAQFLSSATCLLKFHLETCRTTICS